MLTQNWGNRNVEFLYSNNEEQQKIFPVIFLFNSRVFRKIWPDVIFQTSGWIPGLNSSSFTCCDMVNDLMFVCLLRKYWNKETFRLSFVVWRYCQRRKCNLFCGAFAEARWDGIPGETVCVETMDVVIAGELNEMLSWAWEEWEAHFKSSGHIRLLFADIYVFWGFCST